MTDSQFSANRLYETVKKLAADDAHVLEERDKSYGSSWKKRGGVGAFMMLARKWDRIENIVQGWNWDVFSAIGQDPSNDGIIDDIRDLRRYLLLVEAEMTNRGMFSGSKMDIGRQQNVGKGLPEMPYGTTLQDRCFTGDRYGNPIPEGNALRNATTDQTERVNAYNKLRAEEVEFKIRNGRA
jgi:hypothetical protein